MSTSTQRPSPEEQVAAPASEDPHHARRWLILAVILVAQIMILLDTTIVNVALPSAQADLGFSDAARQWVLTAYVLAFGSLLPLGGRLSDIFGRKRTFLAGLAGFAATSAIAGAAPNIGTLIAARATQGAFAAILAPAALSLIAVSWPSQGTTASIGLPEMRESALPVRETRLLTDPVIPGRRHSWSEAQRQQVEGQGQRGRAWRDVARQDR